MAHYIVDRFDGANWAVLEDEGAQTFTIPRHWLPAAAHEGSVLVGAEDRASATVNILRLELDEKATQERVAAARRLREQLPRAPKGDISL